ncbi:MAG: hypothetical protein IJ799_07265 [Bacteroidales bacterium]|nr:hypothetical protein [Bacteroidales bacterium]
MIDEKIRADLGLDIPFVRGSDIPVRNCHHFCTDGNAVDLMFRDEQDYIDGMNRIFVTVREFDVLILAFALMDTHVHFILYGDADECRGFFRKYLNRTSRAFFLRYSERRKLGNVPVRHQIITDDRYLKTAICYTLKNPVDAGLSFQACDYPWSSGSLYFRTAGRWTSPRWLDANGSGLGVVEGRSVLKTRKKVPDEALLIDGVVCPSEYVAVGVVERLFKTVKSYSYFMRMTREDEIDEREGLYSRLSIPLQEMRQNRNELSVEMFGEANIRKLDVGRRMKLAKEMKRRFRSSPKQIAKLCGLVYDQLKDKFP